VSLLFETFEILPSVSLHLRQTTKFKTNTVKIFISRNLDKDATCNAILPFLLRRGTAKHPTMTAIAKRLENLYGSIIGADVLKAGEQQVIEFSLEIPNEKFLTGKKRLFTSALSFLKEIISSPATENGAFREHYLKTEIETMRRFIEGMINDKATYASEQLIRHMCRDEPYSIYEYGDLQTLKSLEPRSLYQHYQNLLSSSPIDIYITGDLEPRKTLSIAKTIFSFERSGDYRLKETDTGPLPREVRRVREETELSQARLLLGLRTNIRYCDEASYPLILASAILGGFPHSKLFRIVREKASLAYSVHSYLIRPKGLLTIYAGVDPATAEEAQSLILRQIDELKEGNISDFEMESTKKSIIDDLQTISDSAAREINFAFVNKLNKSAETPQTAIERILSTTKEQITETARKIQLDTIYLLTCRKV
jgi:predicted Zn-dependent peptidase